MMFFGKLKFEPPPPAVLPVISNNKSEVKPGFLHITDMPLGISEEEGIQFILNKPNPCNLPIKVFPEPDWWGKYCIS
jgi:hypothetical protein